MLVTEVTDAMRIVCYVLIINRKKRGGGALAHTQADTEQHRRETIIYSFYCIEMLKCFN